ncbi:MAG TPA: aminotransferase class I/II-fold pyridoxal phosphate-dependent enzyme [Chloroflexota bacterium]|nr:aminotransferase class I/II-fold pyridoxal phosphate-dependent enzyme [Chloroflexota bacterium]
MDVNEWDFETQVVHGGRETGPIADPAESRPEGLGMPVAPGIQPSAGFYFDRLASLDRAFQDPAAGYVYARHGGPTGDALGRAVALLERADGAFPFASGMAAIHAALLACEVGNGASIVASRDLYGATQGLLTTVFVASMGAQVRFVDTTDISATRQALAEIRPNVLYVETISNPLMRVADIPALAAAAQEAGARLVVDNTFASPYLCRPMERGADVVLHSATKYLSGHGDVTAGVVACRSDLLPQLTLVSRLAGGTLGAFDSWLTLRGLRTLALRLERQSSNALRLAQHLSRHARIGHVHYPGLACHPQHELAARLFGDNGFGGMLSFEIDGAGTPEVEHFMDALRLILPAPTMGDVYSLALYPARASHRGLTPEQRASLGIGDNLVRLSSGVEAIDDLIADVDQALATV